MSPAVTGPIPSIVSSCSTVALPRLIGPSSEPPAGDAAPPATARDEDLLAVAEPGREVDRFELRVAGGAPGALDRVGDPGPGGQPVDAGPAHGPGHVDDDVGAAVREAEAGRAPSSRRAKLSAPAA